MDSFTTALTIFILALLVGVERLRTEARESFANTLSGTDLIVGARSGPVQLLLYAVFRIGDATNNISWKSYQDIAEHPKVRPNDVLLQAGVHRHQEGAVGQPDDVVAHDAARPSPYVPLVNEVHSLFQMNGDLQNPARLPAVQAPT